MKINKDKEKILKYLLKIVSQTNQTYFDNPTPIYEHFEEMPLFEDILNSLANDNLIKLVHPYDGFQTIKVLPEGLSYFEDKRAYRLIYIKELLLSKISDVIIAMVTSIIMYFVMDWIKTLPK
jgi:hypothetical protein